VVADPRTGWFRERAPLPAGPPTPAEGPGTADDPLLTIDEVITELRVSRAAFYRWRRQGAGPAVVRLPGGGVRVRRSTLTAWRRRLEEEDTQDGQEQGADGQLRHQVLGHQEARQRHRGTVPGPWAVDGREHCKPFKARPLADGFLAELKDAVRDRRPFNPRTGLPDIEVTEDEVIAWYQHSRAYTEVKWANLAPVSRRSVAEALVTVTIALSKKEPGAPEPRVLRQALFAWAFNPATRDITRCPPGQAAQRPQCLSPPAHRNGWPVRTRYGARPNPSSGLSCVTAACEVTSCRDGAAPACNRPPPAGARAGRTSTAGRSLSRAGRPPSRPGKCARHSCHRVIAARPAPMLIVWPLWNLACGAGRVVDMRLVPVG
jgi:predicted DNA-binding transcriptional regulator AlpA